MGTPVAVPRAISSESEPLVRVRDATGSPVGGGLTIAGGVSLTVVGATVAAIGLLRVPPARLLGGETVDPHRSTRERTDQTE